MIVDPIPCPFCGRSIKPMCLHYSQSGDTVYDVKGHDEDCILKGIIIREMPLKDFVMSWNRRLG